MPASVRLRVRLYWLLNAHHLSRHKLRIGLSALGIAAGVALAVGVAALGSSIDASVQVSARAVAGGSNVEVRPHIQAGMPPNILEEVRSAPGVTDAGATIERTTQLRRGDRRSTSVLLGVDVGILRLAPEAVGRPDPADGDVLGLYLSRSAAADLDVRPGQAIEVATPSGWQSVGVSDVLDEDTRLRFAAGLIGIVSELTGRTRRVDAVYARADDADRAIAALRETLEGRAMVGPPGLRRTEAREFTSALTTWLGAGAVVALFVGAFLVYNTMSMAAAERVAEGGLLRALGATRGQVFRLLCLEGGLLGLGGAASGAGLGVAVAWALLPSRSGIGELFPIQSAGLVVRPSDIAIGAGIGLGAALLASVLPARHVARTDPAVVLRPTGVLERIPRRAGAAALAGVVLLAAGVGLALTSPSGVSGGVGTLVRLVLLLGGATLLLRAVLPGLAGLLLRHAARPHAPLPRVVKFASGAIIRSPGRTTFTAGAIVLALTLVVGMTVALDSFAASVRGWIDSGIPGDLHVGWPQEDSGLGSVKPLDPSLADELERVPGVAAVTRYAQVTGVIDDRLVFLSASDGGDDRPETDPEAGLSDGALLASPAGLDAFGLAVGDTFEIPTPSGPRGFRVAGTTVSATVIFPTFHLTFDDFASMFGGEMVEDFGVYLDQGADERAVRTAIASRFGGRGVQVQTRDEVETDVLGVLDELRSLLSSITLIGVVIAALGVANTLYISTLERRRELSVLRAVGMLRRQVVATVTAEAVIVAALGVVLAWVLGTGLGWAIRAIIASQSGLEMTMVFPVWAYAGTALLGLMAAVLAAALPARRAARTEIAEGLAYE